MPRPPRTTTPHVLTMLLATAALCSSAPSLAAQGTCTAGGCTLDGVTTAAFAMPKMARVAVDQAATTLTAPAASAFALATGEAVVTETDVNATLPTIRVGANVPWNLSATATAWSVPTGAAKPLGDLELSTDGSSWLPLAATGTYLVGAASGTGRWAGAPGMNAVKVYYRTRWSLADNAPGAYAITVTYTVTTD